MAEKKYLVNGVEKEVTELFNSEELSTIERNTKLFNDAGYGDIDVTLLTIIEREIAQQKFYKIDPEKFIPMDHTQGGFADYITVLRNYITAEGDIAGWTRGVDNDNARRGQDGVKLESVALKVHNLAKMVSYSLFEIRQAQQTGRWNIVTEKERARKIDYDLSVQRALLLGDEDHKGLLNQTDVNTNTTLLTKKISTMTAVEFKAFLASLLPTYYTATEMTALPDTLVIAPSDFLGLGVAVDEQYPVFTTMKQRLEDVFKEMTGNPNAQILPLAYCEPNFHNGNYKYALYRKDFDTLRAYEPFGYNVVQGATVDGMNYQNTAWARLSDVFVNRPKEVVYLSFEE